MTKFTKTVTYAVVVAALSMLVVIVVQTTSMLTGSPR